MFQALYASQPCQTLRTVEAGRELRRSSSPSPGSSSATYSQQPRAVSRASKPLQGRRLHHCPGLPVPGLRHPQSKEVFCDAPVEPPAFLFLPMASGSYLGRARLPLNHRITKVGKDL